MTIRWSDAMDETKKIVEAVSAQQYQDGWNDGVGDATILLHPVNTGPHTYEEYLRIRDKAFDLYYQTNENEYARGYADGMDSIAITDPRIKALHDEESVSD